MLFKSLYAPLLLGALFVSSLPVIADTLTGGLSFRAPQGTLPVGDYPVASGTGSFSFASDLITGLTPSGTVHVLARDLIAFNLTVITYAANFAGVPEGRAATYNFGLADLSAVDFTVYRDPSGFLYSPGFQNLATNAIVGDIPDYGTGRITAANSSSTAGSSLSISIFSYPGYPGGPGFPNGSSTSGRLALTNDGILFPTVTATPEPASFLLTGPVLAGLWFMRRKISG